ncbi:MAG: glycosyl transferase [Candidatus Melainabacteria bacterium RIFOXYA12_FULL_32_12]|nr:MAG: glycosyl transferase [Candidatus Melainabacteria bacterium RIFOXYA2_FULL_32_9]OGI30235.1 MAG: glycosyl transferase [Candidatus Melainabacteria bacterium RIFOXYA12_FULL_32_12]
MAQAQIQNYMNITTEKVDLSIVIPVFNEAESIRVLAESLLKVLENLNRKFEIIFIDDGSTDGSHLILKTLSEEISTIKAVRFRRNFGQTAAMAAGFDYASGGIIITLDGDLQNDPADIPRIIAKFEEGYDVVSGWRKNRQDDFITRKIPSMLANMLISKMTGTYLHDYGCSLKAYRAEIAKELSLYGELHRFIPALASIEGASISEIPVLHHARKSGKSKYNIFRTFKVILDLLTVVFLKKFMTRPLHIFGRIGLFSFITGLAICLHLAFDKIIYSTNIGNRPLLLLGVLLILTGFQLISTGIIAEIQIRTYYESQNKAIYKVKEVYN